MLFHSVPFNTQAVRAFTIEGGIGILKAGLEILLSVTLEFLNLWFESGRGRLVLSSSR